MQRFRYKKEALETIKSPNNSRFIIFAYLMSVIGFRNFKPHKIQKPIMESIINLNSELSGTNTEVICTQIPSYIGIRENNYFVDEIAEETKKG